MIQKVILQDLLRDTLNKPTTTERRVASAAAENPALYRNNFTKAII